jgi:hypothetical protein
MSRYGTGLIAIMAFVVFAVARHPSLSGAILAGRESAGWQLDRLVKPFPVDGRSDVMTSGS